MKRVAITLIAFSFFAGCGKDTPQNATSIPAGEASTGAVTESTTSAMPSQVSTPPTSQFASRTGELANPDNLAMVMLYYDLAGMPAPIPRWVEGDSRLQSAPGPQKAVLREQITAEFEAAREAVKNIGVLRVTLENAELSEYDPSYGEFTIRALSPSSTIPFKALGTEVLLKFDNARTAQLWRVPSEEAQRITDTLAASYGNASIELTLAITGVIPSTAGGTLNTRIVEYELRAKRGGQTLARTTLPP